MATYAPQLGVGLQPQQHQQMQMQVQPQQQQQSTPNAPQRTPSFVGLPPIRRASTFGSSLGFTIESDSQEPQSDVPDTPSLPPPMPMANNPGQAPTQPPGGQYGSQGQFTTRAPPPGQPVYNLYRPTYGPAPGQPPNGPPATQGPPRSLAGGPATPPSNINGVAPPGAHGAQPPFAAASLGGRPPMMPPHMMMNHLQRLPPQAQGGWNLQESHLSEPLQPTNRHRSSPGNSPAQQPFYGFDKEAGVPSTDTAASENDKGDDTEDEAPPKPQHQIGQALTTNNKTAGPQQAPIGSLSRTSTSQSDLQRPVSASANDDGRGRRQSGIIAGIRGKLGGGGGGGGSGVNASDANRRDPWGAPDAPQGVTGDGVSEASIVMDESGQPKKHLPLSRLRNAQNASDNAALYNQQTMTSQGPGAPPVDGNLPQHQPPFPPPEKKRSFFGSVSGGGSSSAPGMLRKEKSDTSRLSTASTNPAEQGHGNGASKKGLSGLFGKLRQGGGNPQLESSTASFKVPTGISLANSVPPTQTQAPLGPGQPPPDFATQPPTVSQSRRDSISSNQSVPLASARNSQLSFSHQGAAGDSDKGRKASGLFGFVKKKSDGKPQPGQQQPILGQGPSGQWPPNHNPTGPQPLGQQLSGRQVPGQQPAGQLPLGQQPLAQQSLGQQTPGQQFPGQQFPGQQVPGQQPPGQQPLGQMGRGQPLQGPPVQTGRDLSSAEQSPPMGRGQAPPEATSLEQQARPSSTGRGYTLTDRPVSMGRGQPPTDQTRPVSMGRGGLAPPGPMGPGAGPQQLGRGQVPPGFAPFPSQFGMQALGPDGKPIILQGQFNPQTGQFMVLLPPGVAPPPNAMVPGMRPMMPGQPSSQLSLLPSLPESRPQSQQGGSPATDQQPPQTNGLHTISPLSRAVSAAQQDSLRPDEPTPPGSRAQQTDSPISQRSQPVSIATQDQSRGSLNTTPVQYRQPFQPPQSATIAAPQPQGFGSPLVGQIPTRKPVLPTPNSPADQIKAQDGVNEAGPRGQRSSSVHSQTRIHPPSQGPHNLTGDVEQSSRVSGSASMHRLSAQQQTQSRTQQQSPSVGSPASQIPPSTSAASASPRPSSFQGTQQQQPGQIPAGQPGAPFFGPGQGPSTYPMGQAVPLGSIQTGPQPDQPFPPSGLHPPGASMPAPKEKEQSTLSKLLKGTKGPSQDKPEKKSIFSFRREPKQAPTQPLPPQAQTQAGQIQPYPPQAQPLRPQMTGPGPRPTLMQMQPLRPQVTGPQATAVNMQPLRPQMTGPPSSTYVQPLRPQMTGPQAFPIQPFAVPIQAGRGAEPQYAQVPIPAGYGFVHGEGSVAPAPAPYIAGTPASFAIPPGQASIPGAPQPMWPQGAIRPVWATPSPGQLIPQPRPVGTQDFNGSAAAPSSAQDRQQAVPPQGRDQQPAPPVNGTASVQPTGRVQQPVAPQLAPILPQPSVTSQFVSPASVTGSESQYVTRSEFTQPAPGPSQGTANPMLPPQARQAASPAQAYPIPHSAFSTVKPPHGPTVTPPGQKQNGDGSLAPKRQPSAVSQVSLQQGAPSRSSNLSSPAPHASPAGQSSDVTSPRITPDRGVSPEPVPSSIQGSRNVSPEPPGQLFGSPQKRPQMQIQPPQDDGQQVSHPTSQYSRPAPVNPRSSLQVQPQTPRNMPEDNIYDATPRTSTVPPQYRDDTPKRNSAPTAEPKSPGPSRETAKAKSPELNNSGVVPSPIDRDGTIDFKNPPIKNRTAAVAESSDMANGLDTPPKAHSTDRELFEEAKRRRLLREQEEKIPVFPTEPDANPPKKDEEELPQMSATSYPGQEWNPYEAGFGDWDD